ncbi:MAG TPA: DUF6064 family protein [Deltaproteobacteria bacterium]|jgi:hypothetical protein|nr:DUF6064 family protein [Deltaproteobacteria bacterium]HOI07347.1 DUF6064 family protein [Deltaproteobacteria bacterium]
MQLPFTVDEFFGIFRAYNETLWPVQIVLFGLALAAFALVLKPRRPSGVGISVILAFLWAWIALVYHLGFFARINPLAHVFSAVSLVGALIFVWQGVIRRRLRFAWGGGIRALAGSGLIVFALILYPLWSRYGGHAYPDMPTFGLPCPTTIFTIGLLAFLVPPYPRSPFIVPVLWCLVGTQAAFLLGVHQDLGLVVAGTAGIVLSVRSKTSSL